MSTTHDRLPLINEGFAFKKAGERITHSEWNAVLETFAKCYNNLVLDTDKTANAVLTALAGKSEQGHAHNTTDINGLSSLITRMIIASIDLSEYVTNEALNTKVSEALAHAKDNCVSYSEAQALTDEQKKMARENIGVNTTVSIADDGYGNIALNIKGAGMDVTFTDDGNGNIKMEAM